MDTLSLAFGKWIAGIGAGMLALVVGALAFPKLRAHALRLGRFLVIPAVIGLLVLIVVLHRAYPPSGWARSTRLPDEFIGGYWAWLILLIIGAIASAVLYIRISRRSSGASARQIEERFPDVETAWDEIALRLDQAGIDPVDQTYYLVLSPDESQVRSLIETAGSQVFVTAPDGPSALRAFATSDGVLLSCAGVSGFGRNDPSSSARLAALCKKLLALRPDAPPVGGVTIAIPVPWLDRDEASTEAKPLREDLRAIRQTLGLRCPVFVLFTGMEHVPGFTEFIDRMEATGMPQVLAQRVGFAVPRSEPFSGDLMKRGMVWMSGWLHTWNLNLLAADPLNAPGNERLVTLDFEFRRRRKRFCSVLESALATPRGGEPIFFRGCYFAATGEGRGERAFAAGLLRGARGRILADHVTTSWTDSARDEDRRHGKAALIVGLAVGAICLLLWAAIISRTTWGWAGLLALAVAWGVVLLRLPRR